MLQAPIAELDIGPGQVVEWRLRPPASAGTDRSPAATSYNQDKHFCAAEDSREAEDPLSSYVACTFEVEGPVDEGALEAALLSFVRRHDVLRCEFGRTDDDLTCATMEPDEVVLDLVDVGSFADGDTVRSYVSDCFQRIDTLAWPLFVMGAVSRADSSTVFLAFDHIVSDGMSTPIAVHEVSSAYDALRRGGRSEFAEVGGYIGFSRDQRRRNRAVTADDDRLEYWRSFMERNGDFFPAFPLDLGVKPGHMYRTVNESDLLLGDHDADTLETRCRAVDGRLFMGVLAAVGVSLWKEGGPEVYRGLMPVSERGKGSYTGSMGWFVNTMPIEFDVEQGKDFGQVMANVGAGTAEMLANVDVPFVKAWHLLAPEYASLRSWPFAVNFFSYIDFRKAPGSERHLELSARKHVWASHSNGICFWFHRNDTGLHVNAIYADTPEARRTKSMFMGALKRTLTNMADFGRF